MILFYALAWLLSGFAGAYLIYLAHSRERSVPMGDVLLCMALPFVALMAAFCIWINKSYFLKRPFFKGK